MLKLYFLLLVGAGGGASFLFLGDLERVFNKEKEWVAKISNSDGAGFIVSNPDGMAQRKGYSGEWRFLTVDTGREAGHTKEAIIDLAVRQRTKQRVWDWSNKKQKEIRIFKCLGEPELGEIEALNSKNKQKLYCQDLAEKFYYGWLGDQQERVSFVINKKVIKHEKDGWEIFTGDLDSLSSSFEAKYAKLKKWIENNVLATSAWTTVKATINTTRGKCSELLDEAVENEWCFMLGHKYKNSEVTNKKDEEVNQQIRVSKKIKIIDVSSYTLSKDGRHPNWNIEFLPKITWESVQQQ